MSIHSSLEVCATTRIRGEHREAAEQLVIVGFILPSDYHKKQNALRALQKKALDKNPDEFYFKMIRAEVKDGVHIIKQPKDEITPEQVKLMRTQDIKYVEMKRVAEAKVITHIFRVFYLFLFFFSCIVREFDIAAHLDTVPELVDRVYNRPTIATLQREAVKGPTDPALLKKLAQQRKNQYDLLRQRIEREKAMFVISQKIQTRKDLLDKTHKVKVKKETTTAPAIYKFKFQRKR
uniref:U3 small nucleolar RNA-associated protein 11 n=1 Tax=Serinus canaria TaxID=9135 RepID=A0A8C9NP68_SERCA